MDARMKKLFDRVKSLNTKLETKVAKLKELFWRHPPTPEEAMYDDYFMMLNEAFGSFHFALQYLEESAPFRGDLGPKRRMDEDKGAEQDEYEDEDAEQDESDGVLFA